MANIIFTNRCNIKCPFCFATENNIKENNELENGFSMENTWEISKFLKNKTFRFCGGEPTQNKNIIKAIKALLKDDFRFFIMTNGIWETEFLNFVKNISAPLSMKITYLINVLEKSFYTKSQLNKLISTLESINPFNTVLGFTIYKKNQNYSYIFELAEKYNIKSIRVSIAAPYITSGEYELENDFNEIAKEIHQLVLYGHSKNIKLVGDCGSLPPCYYEDHAFKDIQSLSSIKSLSCKYSAVDIDKEGNVWRCYGLYPVLRQNIKNFKNDEEIGKYFDRRILMLRNLYLYKDCIDCKYWYKSCTGGCHAVRIKKVLNQNPNICLFPVDDDKEILNCIPKLASSTTLKYDENQNLITIFKKEGIINNPDENTTAFLMEIDEQKTISILISLWRPNFSSDETATNTIVNKCRELFELDIIELDYNYKYKPEKKLKQVSVD